ncbi:MAG: dTDP-4-dehydrorhamnose reductase [Saprospiraceae bacterium]|nr:dTDP-4-dehydrorhamnose reductase [Saprospiraceae bacterium]
MLLITGANGQLGRCFQHLAAQFPALDVHFATSSELDITDKRSIKRFFQQYPVKWVINCAAYTAVDKAESEPDQAQKVNVLGVKYLAEACAEHGAKLVHFSTDYVYHNRHNLPFKEDEQVSPKGVYARTKLAGERAAMHVHPGGVMIIRTSWVYAREGHNFVNTMLRLGRERGQVRVVCDQIGSPTYAPDLAAAVFSIIDRTEKQEIPKENTVGIWHYSNEGVASWYDFACAIFEISGIACKVEPIETIDFPTPAQRPPFSVLNKSKIKAAFGLAIPHWRESLAACLGERIGS